MTQGYPLVMARHRRRRDPFAPSNFIIETSGSPVGAGVTFVAGEPRFINHRGVGHFLCVLQSTTEREDLRMEVIAPPMAAQAWNIVEAKKVTWDQVISIPVNQSGPRGSIMELGTPEKLSRSLVCNSHLSLEWMVALNQGQECVVAVDGDPNRTWELCVIRMLPEGLAIPFVEHPNLLHGTAQHVFSGPWTLLPIPGQTSLNRPSPLFIYDRLTNISQAGFAVAIRTWALNPPFVTTFAHTTIVKIRKSATHPGGGTVRVQLQNQAGTVTYVVQTVAIPTDDTVVDVVYNGPPGGPFATRVFLDEFAIGEQLEISVGCLVAS